MTGDTASALKLTEQPYLALIPKSILHKQGIDTDTITFDLVVNDGKIALIGPPISDPRVTQPGFEEIVT